MSIVDDFKSINARLDEIERRPASSAVDPDCSVCEGAGWEMYGTGRGDPHFRVCPACGNPEGHHQP